MKLKITFKDPDVVTDAIREAVAIEVSAIEQLSTEEKEDLIASRAGKVETHLEKWITYGEYVTIEFDTDAGTATVQRAKIQSAL